MTELNLVHVFQLKVWLQEISPMVWRRLLVRSDSTIADLHYTIQIAIGWSDVHLNRFHIHGKDFGVYHDGGMRFADNPEEVVLSAFGFRTRERFIYEYDFGDEWLHEVRIEKRLPLDPKKTYPVCIDGKHAAPPEDFGGAQAYMQMRQELKYRSVFGDNGIDDDFDDENDPEYERSEEDQPFDPDVFSRREVNVRLRQYTKGDRDWLFSY
ncbi:MAG: plasmid pRiA4b ORF-3 family protein [Methylococcaceae bacterium]|jgi:hypothetical protein